MGKKTPRGLMSPEELARVQRRERLMMYRRQQGLAGFVDAKPMQAKIREWVGLGVTMETIAQKSGVSAQMVRWHNAGVYRGQPLDVCLMETRDAILGARITEEDAYLMPVLGSQRRVQALSAIGYGVAWQARKHGVTPARLYHAVAYQKQIEIRFAARIADLYDKYCDRDPAEEGMPQKLITRSKNIAVKNGYAPPHCWDPDTIDNPNANPEWTGECGTYPGYRIHYRDQIPYCDPCREAKRRYDRARDKQEGDAA